MFDNVVGMAGAGLCDTTDPLEALTSAASTVAAQYLPGIEREDLGERCLTLMSVREVIDAALATSIAEAERAGVPALGKQRTMAQYLASRSHCAPEIVRADARVGLWVSQFAQLEEAMLDGVLSRKHVEVLRRTENIRVFVAMQRDQQLFIEWVTTLEWNGFKQALAYWLMVNDQDGPAPEDHEAKNSCNITQTPDGRVRITANLDPASGAILKHQIELEAGRVFDDEQQDGIPTRTATQRRAKALANLVSRGANRSEASTEPLVHVVMSLKVLQHTIAQMAKPVEEQDFTSYLDAQDVDGRCELVDGTPLHPKAALLLALNARIRGQVLTAKSKTLDASEELRLFPRWMKYIRLIECRGQCETAGCDAKVEWLRADHHRPYTQTQRTTLDDLRMLCDPDNKLKADGPPLAERGAPTGARTEQSEH